MKTILLDLVRLAGDQARLVLMDLRQPLMPSWVYIDARGKAHIVATPWRNDIQKEVAARQMRVTMRKAHAVAYSLVVEAWSATVSADWNPDQPLPEAERPVNRADRQESVIAFATDGKETEWKAWDTKRDWNERVIALKERLFDGAQAESWMTKLL